MIDQVWQERWNGLEKQLLELTERFNKAEQPASAHFGRMETFFVLVKSLSTFGKSQFDFFNDGFSLGLLEADDKFRAETALAATLDQISFDIAVIRKAANQRILGNNLDLKTLNIADFLTGEAIKFLPTMNNVLEAGTVETETFVMREPSTIITYFQKSYSIRLMPYAPIVFIGIPLTCKYTYRDFLAIPHEVGHFVYRHSLIHRNLYEEITEKDPKIVEWTKDWMEEIFADIYGAIIAGPIIGLSFQNLQMNYNIVDFYTGDGSHPVPVLRPYIYVNTLEKLEGDDVPTTWSSRLRDNWKSCLTRRVPEDRNFKFDLIGPDFFNETNINLKFKLKDNPAYFDVSGAISTEKIDENSKKALDIAVNKIQGIILENIEHSQWLKDIKWPSRDEENALLLLYEKFEAYIESLFEESFPIDEFDIEEGVIQVIKSSINEEGVTQVNQADTHRKLGTTSSPKVEEIKNNLLEIIKNYDPDKQPDERPQISRDDWLKVLDAGGWTVEGPDCESTGGVCAG